LISQPVDLEGDPTAIKQESVLRSEIFTQKSHRIIGGLRYVYMKLVILYLSVIGSESTIHRELVRTVNCQNLTARMSHASPVMEIDS
jgi:hypothetical protein